MATINKNIDNIIAKAVHGPKVDDIPLYARLDGDQEQGFNKTAGNKSEKWEKACLSSYTSPNNVRKVFISGDKVVVQLYKPVIIKGKPDSRGCWREFTIPKEDSLRDNAIKSLTYQQRRSKYFMEQQINPNAKEPDLIRIRGTGLGALSSPWVCSNIEEVYFDWTLLASEKYRNAGIGCEELLQEYLKGKRGFMQHGLPLDMFLHANMGNVQDLRSRYPRLRVVGLISELGKILELPFDRGKTGLDSLEDSVKLWVKSDVNVELLKKSNSLIVVTQVNEDIPLYNPKFALRDGIYKYDEEVLREYFSGYARRVDARGSGRSLKKVVDTKVEKSELEILLDNIQDKYGTKEVRNTLLLTFSGRPINEMEEAFAEMSAEGEKKYRDLII